MINKIKEIAGDIKESVVSTGVTMKQLAMGKAHMQDYMVVGLFFLTGLGLGSCL